MAIKDEVEEILRGEAKRHDDFKDIEQQFVGLLETPKD